MTADLRNTKDLERVRATTNEHGEVFRMSDGTYLKTNPGSNEQKSGIQDQMYANHFPVPQIMAEGMTDDSEPFVIFSDMEQTFETIENGDIDLDEADFTDILKVLQLWTVTQIDQGLDSNGWDPLEALYVDDLVREVRANLPGSVGELLADDIESIRQKLGDRLSLLPAVYSHGDFVPRNLTKDGVIDLEFAHVGVFGMDAISLMFHPYMFPEKSDIYDFEACRTYQFKPEQILQMIDTVDESVALEGDSRFSDYIDDLIIAKLIWSSGDDDARPNLHQWRYRALHECIKAYRSDEKLGVARALMGLSETFEHTRQSLLGEFRDAVQTIYGDNLTYAFVCGSFARSDGYVSPRSDVDMVVVSKEHDNVQMQRMQEAYTMIHQRYFFTPDDIWGCEQFTEADLSRSIRMARTLEPVSYIREEDVALFDGTVLSSMHIGDIAGFVGDRDAFLRMYGEGEDVQTKWLEALLPPEDRQDHRWKVKFPTTYEGDDA